MGGHRRRGSGPGRSGPNRDRGREYSRRRPGDKRSSGLGGEFRGLRPAQFEPLAQGAQRRHRRFRRPRSNRIRHDERRRLAGDVKGQTMNGGLAIDLAGAGWDGKGMDVRTTNGGVTLSIPENYSAHLETGTVNGGLKTDFPITLQGEVKRELSFDLGGGGQTISAMTTNGGVSIKRKS